MGSEGVGREVWKQLGQRPAGLQEVLGAAELSMAWLGAGCRPGEEPRLYAPHPQRCGPGRGLRQCRNEAGIDVRCLSQTGLTEHFISEKWGMGTVRHRHQGGAGGKGGGALP